MSRLVALLAVLSFLVFAVSAHSDALINTRVGNSDYQPTACMVTGPTRDGTGWWQNSVFIWRTTGANGYEVASSGLSMTNIASQGALPAPIGWIWYQDVQVRASAGSTDMGSFCVCGMLRSTSLPRLYAVGTLRGWLPDSVTVLWDLPQAMQIVPSPGGNLYVGELAIDSHRESNFVTLVHPTSFTSPTPQFWMRQSQDGGATWGAPVSLGADSTSSGWVSVQCGAAAGDVWVVSVEGAAAGNTILSRRALADGSGFEPPVTSGFPAIGGGFGPHEDFGANIAIEANRDALSGQANHLYAAATLGLVTPGKEYPAVDSSPALVEPNIGDPVVPGTVLRGSFTSTITPVDTNYYAFSLTAGQFVSVWLDSVTPGAFTEMGWTGLHGGEGLLTGTYSNTDPLGFVAPVTAVYYLRTTTLTGTAPIGFRLRTMTAALPVSGTRDQGDLFIWDHPPGAWQPPINMSAQLAGIGTQEGGVALASNLDGYLYASWFDWGLNPGMDIVRRLMSRSPDGGLSWDAPVVLSSAASWWGDLGYLLPRTVRSSGMGLRNVIAHDGVRMCVPWTDHRLNTVIPTTDVFAAVVDRSLDISTPMLTAYSVHPGDKILVPVAIKSRDAYFDWRLPIIGQASGRSWFIPSDQASIGPLGSSAPVITITVPDTAAPGTVPVDFNVVSWYARSRVIGNVHIDLTVLPGPLSVGGQAPQLALALPSPNPASVFARIGFSLGKTTPVRLVIYGVDGRRVRTLERGDLAAGVYARSWAGDDDAGQRVAAGAYFVRLTAEGRTITRRLAWMN